MIEFHTVKFTAENFVNTALSDLPGVRKDFIKSSTWPVFLGMLHKRLVDLEQGDFIRSQFALNDFIKRAVTMHYDWKFKVTDKDHKDGA
jgi:hypothetical protein